jgi:predicted lipoprotein with Yx(FWY)xxD motif
MLRKHVGPLAALLAVGAIALTACGGGSSAAPADAPATSQGAQAENASDFTLLSGTSKSNKADQTTGDLAPADAPQETKNKWVQLRVTNAGGLEPAVVNGAGRTVYWFSDDPVGTKDSNCNDECEKKWPAVTVGKGGKVIISGIDKTKIGFIKRKDGRTQVPLGGRPMYLFSGDSKPGDINGQNLQNKWFVINPEGKRAVPAAEATTPPPASNPSAKPASSVTLFTGKNFDDFSGNNFASGVAVAKTCTDVRGPFNSLTTDGAVKIWSEPGCKGKSAVVTEDVRDVTALGFPNGIQSLIATS